MSAYGFLDLTKESGLPPKRWRTACNHQPTVFLAGTLSSFSPKLALCCSFTKSGSFPEFMVGHVDDLE